MGSDPEKLFSWSVFQDQLKRYGGYGLIMCLLQIETVFGKAEPQEEGLSKVLFGLNKTKNEMKMHVAEAIREAIRLGFV